MPSNTELLTPPPLPASSGNSAAGNVYEAQSGIELQDLIRQANPRDTIVVTRAGNYGTIRVTGKRMLRLKSYSTDLPLQIALIIDGGSQEIIVENMQLWNADTSIRQVLISSPDTSAIIIRGCIFSSAPLNTNTMRDHYSGHPPSWINGVRLLGRNSQLINNFMMNLKIAVVNTGLNNLIQHNLFQFFAEDAIRVTHHNTRVLNNNIYDAVAAVPNQRAHRDAIQLIPPKDRYNGGILQNVQIIGNIIQSHTQPGSVQPNERGILQGIFGSDGYFVNMTISSNTVIVNSDHGISLNGVLNLNLNYNRILDVTPGDNFNPGIKFYLTRISLNGQQRWLANRQYSVTYRGNQAPILNIPNESYRKNNGGNNRFLQETHDLARGVNPIIVRGPGAGSTTPELPTPVIDSSPAPVPTDSPSSLAGQTYLVNDKTDLDNALRQSGSGDTIVIRRSHNYGVLRITNKNNLRIRAQNLDAPLQCHILIDGNSRNIILENMNLWFSESNWKPVILSAPGTRNITIRNCLISSVPNRRTAARNQPVGPQSRWITGIWLRGEHNEVVNNHIVNVKMGVMLSGKHNLLQNNLIQYFTETAVRLFNDHCRVQHNNIYDAITSEDNPRRLKTGIQLIPAVDRFNGGEIEEVHLRSNIIQSRNAGSVVNDTQHGLLQGITLYDGYLMNSSITENTIVVNTSQGIVLNGVNKLELNKNRVFDATPQDRFVPGIRLYLTRTTDLNNNRQQVWRTGKAYSVILAGNRSPVLNIPADHYFIDDQSGNQFAQITRDNARGVNPVLAP